MNTLVWAIILVVVLRAYAKQWLHWIVAAFLLVIAPYLVDVGSMMLANLLWGRDLGHVFDFVNPITALLQLAIALGVLYWLERREESLSVWVVGVGLLFFGLLYAVPYAASYLTA